MFWFLETKKEKIVLKTTLLEQVFSSSFKCKKYIYKTKICMAKIGQTIKRDIFFSKLSNGDKI